MKSFTDVSVDLETYGTEPGCVILEVAFVVFDRLQPDRSMKTINLFPSIDEQLELGFKMNHDTLTWWMRENREGWDRQLNAERISLEETAAALTEFIHNHVRPADVLVWAKGSHFDFPILRTIMAEPWGFRNIHDLRTLQLALPLVQRLERDVTKFIPHHGLDDAMFQAMEIQKLCSMIETDF